MDHMISRRQFIKTALGFALIGSVSELFEGHAFAQGGVKDEKIDIAVVKSSSVDIAVQRAVEILGGMNRFVKSGDVVVIKPNMGFPNPPTWGSTTNPEVIAALAKLCLDSGARSILVIDHPMGRAEECLRRTGIAEACKGLGSDKVKISAEMEQRDYVEVRLEKAKALEKTEIHKAVLKANCLINVPVAKSHSATNVSFSMKNLMGTIWDRAYLHQKIDLHQGIADLSTFIKPSLIVVDATRVLTTRGPEGPGATVKLDTIIAGLDPVAVDSYCLGLSTWNGRKLEPKDVKHISIANSMQIGDMDLSKKIIKHVEL